MGTPNCDCEAFYRSIPPPDDLDEIRKKAEEFVQRHGSSRTVALVTSGGTTVPLEKNTVRFIDNFSSGGRGSKSAEYFLAHGYAVIFLHRSGSLRPFERRFKRDNPLEWFTASQDGGKVELNYSGSPGLQSRLLQVLPLYQKTKEEGSLVCFPFTTVFQYLFYLRVIGLALQPLGPKALIYLAAAVSDFYIAPSLMPDHKIQSTGKLELEFSHTPKMVQPLVSEWAPRAFTVTFKLETEEVVLLPHAKRALSQYGHQVVVANLLGSHQTTVTMVNRARVDSGGGCGEGVAGGVVIADSGKEEEEEEEEWEALQLQLSREDISRDIELESLIIKDLFVRHQNYLPPS